MKKLSEIFSVRYGHSLELNRLILSDEKNGIPFISRKMGDNGVSAYVAPIDGILPNPAGELTCALSGNGVLTTFIQQRPYYTGFHIACLNPLEELSLTQLLYYCICIHANRFRFSWGRQANRTLKNILLPSLDEIPKWVYSVNLDYYYNAARPLRSEHVEFNTDGWKWYLLSDLFNIAKGKRLTKANMTQGDIPFIGSIDNNNGLSSFVGQMPIHEGNTITVNYNGSVAEAFYQPKPFWASDDVNVLYPKFSMNSAIALFIITVIRQEKYRFNYGRKWHLERMEHSQIKLPTKSDGTPDYIYMETYIKSLPFSTQIG